MHPVALLILPTTDGVDETSAQTRQKPRDGALIVAPTPSVFAAFFVATLVVCAAVEAPSDPQDGHVSETANEAPVRYIGPFSNPDCQSQSWPRRTLFQTKSPHSQHW